MPSLFCPLDVRCVCQRKRCALAVAYHRKGETVWTCGLVHPSAGDRIVIDRGDGPHETMSADGGDQCRA